MYPTLAGLAGAATDKHKPLDGMDVWATLSEGKPSPRTEVVYDIEPFRAALRQGNWKLVWRVTLPSQIELFDLAKDPEEQTNLAEQNPQVVAELEQRIQVLSRDAVPPLILQEALPGLKRQLFSSVVLPEEARSVEAQP